MMPLGKCHNLIHIAHVAIEVDGDYGLGPLGDEVSPPMAMLMQ